MKFSELNLPSVLLEALQLQSIETATPIQVEVFPTISEGRSALGLSKTGTGKTLAYLLPTLTRLLKAKENPEHPAATGKSPCVLVLIPTRELAYQVTQSLSMFPTEIAKGLVIVGGEPEDKQLQALAANPRWIVATPGRLLDLIRRRALPLETIETLVFDEADRLLDMGFIDDIRDIVKALPSPLQMLFFSATLHFGVEFERFGQEGDQVTVEGLDHKVAMVGDHEKFHALCNFLVRVSGKRGIVFSNYKERAHETSTRLRGLGYRVQGLSSQLSQSERARIVEEFRAGELDLLVASDLAARGLDFMDLDYVVNLDLPEDPATYVHRVGRTARAGKTGEALSFVGFEDAFRLEKLERFLNIKIERFAIDPAELSGPMPRSPRDAEHQVPRPERSEFSRGDREGRGRSGGSRGGGERVFEKGASAPFRPRPEGEAPTAPRASANASAKPRSQSPGASAKSRVGQPLPKSLATRTKSVWGRLLDRIKRFFKNGDVSGKSTHRPRNDRASSRKGKPEGSRRPPRRGSGASGVGPVRGSGTRPAGTGGRSGRGRGRTSTPAS